MSRLGVNGLLLVYNNVIDQMISSDNLKPSNIDYDLLNDLGFKFNWSEDWDDDWDEDWEDIDYLYDNEPEVVEMPELSTKELENDYEQEQEIEGVLEALKEEEDYD